MFTNIVKFFFGKPRSASTQAVDPIIKISTPVATTLAEKVEDNIGALTSSPTDKHKAHPDEAPATPKAVKPKTAKPKVAKPRAKKQDS